MSVVCTTAKTTFAIQPCLRARALLKRTQHSTVALHQRTKVAVLPTHQSQLTSAARFWLGVLTS